MPSRLALRLAYDGTRFFGFQRQPGKRTVEGELLSALTDIGAIADSRTAHYRSSSRTDRGVSAICNIASVDTEFEPGRLPLATNAHMDDVWCTGVVELSDTFDVRMAKSRTYVCFLLYDGQDIRSMKAAAKAFVGTHDFSRYARIDKRDPVRTIHLLDVSADDELITFRIRGDSFLWNQARRIVWALDQVGKGKAEPEELSPGNYPLNRIGLVRPERLVLESIDIGHEFLPANRGGNLLETMRRRLVSSHTDLFFARTILSSLE
ncbi:MAG TPA: tRNA pseudouridine(38-40) synthase TruA [Euryarchaeota archaeon]|nr:tRNA pseudouridine(38-40) synthase TruA [Euryarchaeota archaeon]